MARRISLEFDPDSKAYTTTVKGVRKVQGDATKKPAEKWIAHEFTIGP